MSNSPRYFASSSTLYADFGGGCCARLVEKSMSDSKGISGFREVWEPIASPSFAALFPDRVTREPETMSVEEIYRELCPPLPFRSDLPAQPRPDDADPTKYPVRGGRDD